MNGNLLQDGRRRDDDVPTFKKPFAIQLRPVAITIPDSRIEIALDEIMHRRIGVYAQVDLRMAPYQIVKTRQQPVLCDMRRYRDVEDIVPAPKLIEVSGNCPEMTEQAVGKLLGFRQHDKTVACTNKQSSLQTVFQSAQMLAYCAMCHPERMSRCADGAGSMEYGKSSKRIQRQPGEVITFFHDRKSN